MDYTCIEIYESDDINDVNNYFKIDPILFTNEKNFMKDSDIFILQYPNNNESLFSFSNGKILSIKENEIMNSASTDEGSSGSPIIRRCKGNYIIGLHRGGYLKKEKCYLFNISTIFVSILNDISKNEINCTYINKNNENKIQLLHDYMVENFNSWEEEYIKLYLEAKKLNKKIFEEIIEIYINGEKVKFNYKYKVNPAKEIKVKYKIKKNLVNISYMFYRCYSLESIDFSSFNSNNVTNMICLLDECTSLKSVNLSTFNTNNVNNMSFLFKLCYSLESIDLSSFNTNNVNKMKSMFYFCKTLKSLDLSKFNTYNTTNMRRMFSHCYSLKSLDLSSFNTNKVTNMTEIFHGCYSLNIKNIKIDKKDKLFNYIIQYYNQINSKKSQLPLSPFDNFSEYLLELINKLRKGPQSFIDVIKKAKKNIIIDKYGRLIYKGNFNIALNEGEKAFDNAINFLKNLKSMQKLEFNPYIAVELPKNEKEIKDKNYLLLKVKNILNNGLSIKYFWKDVIMDPELSFLMMIVNDSKKRIDLLNPNIKYIGINSIEIKENFVCYITLV